MLLAMTMLSTVPHLEPCPFCGSKWPALNIEVECQADWRIVCVNGHKSAWRRTLDDACKDWNTREAACLTG